MSSSRLSDEEKSYRRGFDQGAAAMAYALGIDGATLGSLAFKRRIADFRFGRVAKAPWEPTGTERMELRAALFTAESPSPSHHP